MSPKQGIDLRTVRDVASRYTERRNSGDPNARNQRPRFFFLPFLNNFVSKLEMFKVVWSVRLKLCNICPTSLNILLQDIPFVVITFSRFTFVKSISLQTAE